MPLRCPLKSSPPNIEQGMLNGEVFSLYYSVFLVLRFDVRFNFDGRNALICRLRIVLRMLHKNHIVNVHNFILSFTPTSTSFGLVQDRTF